MSINHFFNKIKSKIGLDNITILYFFIIIGVGIASFGLGQLSASYHRDIGNNIEVKDSNENILDNNSFDEIKIIEIDKNISTENTKEKMYVASKNGKLYYEVSCSGANRIKEENKVWFATTVDAEKSGYAHASSCK
jgi:hypothetical protein